MRQRASLAGSRWFCSGLLRCGGLRLQRVLGGFDQAGKGDFVTNREITQDLAVERDVRGVEALDEAAVGDAVVTAGGVETHDPEATTVGLLLLAGRVGVLPGVLDSFFRVAEELGFIAELALGVFQHFLAALARRGGVSCTSHVLVDPYLG